MNISFYKGIQIENKKRWGFSWYRSKRRRLIMKNGLFIALGNLRIWMGR